MAKKIEFKVGDAVVYPGHGVGEIHSVKSKQIGGTQHRFYEILMRSSGMKIMVPVDQSEMVGLRRVVGKQDVTKIYRILKTKKRSSLKNDSQTWNRRFREYSEKLKTGSPFEIAEVFRDLSLLEGGKELSFGERKMKDMAEQLLVSELAIAKKSAPEKVVGEIRSLLQ